MRHQDGHGQQHQRRARDAAEQLLADPAVAVAHPHDKQVGVQIGRQKQELVGDLRRRIALVHLRGNSVPVQPPVHIEPAERRDRGCRDQMAT